MVPGAFTKGTNHFAHAGSPADAAVKAAYDTGPYADVAVKSLEGLAAQEPEDADASSVAVAITEIVDALGKRPYRVYVDPAQDGAEEVFRVGDRIRREMFRTIGLQDLLKPRINVTFNHPAHSGSQAPQQEKYP